LFAYCSNLDFDYPGTHTDYEMGTVVFGLVKYHSKRTGKQDYMRALLNRLLRIGKGV